LPLQAPAQAQVTLDVTKVNCDQLVHHKISEPRLIAAWLSGYYSAERNNRLIDLQTLEEKGEELLQRREEF
jgi:acid stress chaperone HdeB